MIILFLQNASGLHIMIILFLQNASGLHIMNILLMIILLMSTICHQDIRY